MIIFLVIIVIAVLLGALLIGAGLRYLSKGSVAHRTIVRLWKLEIDSTNNALVVLFFGVSLVVGSLYAASKVAMRDSNGNDNTRPSLAETPTPNPPTPTSTTLSTPTPTDMSSAKPRVEIEQVIKQAGGLISIANQTDHSWPFTISVKVFGVADEREPKLWVTHLLHEAESGQGLWVVQGSAQASETTPWERTAFIDDSFFSKENRTLHTIELLAIITNEQLEQSSNLKIIQKTDQGIELMTYCPKVDLTCSDTEWRKLRPTPKKGEILLAASSNIVLLKADKVKANQQAPAHVELRMPKEPR